MPTLLCSPYHSRRSHHPVSIRLQEVKPTYFHQLQEVQPHASSPVSRLRQAHASSPAQGGGSSYAFHPVSVQAMPDASSPVLGGDLHHTSPSGRGGSRVDVPFQLQRGASPRLLTPLSLPERQALPPSDSKRAKSTPSLQLCPRLVSRLRRAPCLRPLLLQEGACQRCRQ